MKKNLISIFVISFILIFMISFFFIPKKEFSENENRNLEKFPKFTLENLIEGKYISSIEQYITDHFLFRDVFMGIKTRYQLLLNQKLINDVYVGSDEYLFQRYVTPVNTEKLINRLNEFYSKNKENNNNIKMNLMLVPSSGVINIDKVPKDVDFNRQLDTISKIYNSIEFSFIDLYETLLQGKKENEMYYRLDHHWTTHGAYRAYLKFCTQNNIVPFEKDSFNIKTVTTDFNGTLYSKANIYSYKPDQIEIYELKNNDTNTNQNNNDIKVEYVASNKTSNTLYEEKHLQTKDKYAYFLDANHALIKITNESKNNVNNETRRRDNILIIKDSYANSFIPFLTNHYNTIHVVDLRFYNASITEYIKENNIEEVLFLYSIQEIDNDTGIYSIK